MTKQNNTLNIHSLPEEPGIKERADITEHNRNNICEEEHCRKLSVSSGNGLDYVLNFEMRGYIQSILANTELLKLRRAQTLDHKTVTFLDKIERNCAKLDDLLDNCLGLYLNELKMQDVSPDGK